MQYLDIEVRRVIYRERRAAPGFAARNRVVREAMAGASVEVEERNGTWILKLYGRRAISTLYADMAINNWALAVLSEFSPS